MRDSRTPALVRWLALAVAFAWLSGCATMAGRKQVVSIDSDVRGLDVVDVRSGRALGKTPLFLELPRASSHWFVLKAQDGGVRELPVPCRYRWRGSLLANAPLGLLALAHPAAGVAAFVAGGATDLVVGSAFDCPMQLTAHAPEPRRPLPEAVPEPVPEPASGVAPPAPDRTCPRAIVLPVPGLDERIGKIAANKWKVRFLAAESCRELADERRSAQFFLLREDDRVGLGEGEPTNRAAINELGLRSGATHAAELRVDEPAPGRLRVRPVLHDLHSLARVEEEPYEVLLAEEPDAPHNAVTRKAGELVKLLPNSVSFAVSDKRFAFAPKPGWRLLSDAPTGSVVPSLLANWSVAWVEPPGSHGPWSAGIDLAPTFVATYNERRLTVQRDGAEGPGAFDTQVVHAVLVFDAKMTFHTPAGVVGFAAGMGAGAAWHWKDAGFKDWTFRPYAHARLDYTAFVNERLFLQVALNTLGSPSPHVVGEGWTLSELRETSLTLGYRLPELRSWARNLF
jgi:hypothetical protein